MKIEFKPGTIYSFCFFNNNNNFIWSIGVYKSSINYADSEYHRFISCCSNVPGPTVDVRYPLCVVEFDSGIF